MISEVIENIKRHKFRTAVTSLGIAWGILILIVLIGVGSGFKRGVLSTFESFTINSIWVYFNKTSVPFEGLRNNRAVRMTHSDLNELQENMEEIESVSPELYIGRKSRVKVLEKEGWFDVKGVSSDYFSIKKIPTLLGRKVNKRDVSERRSNVLIGEDVAKHFWTDAIQAYGEKLEIDGMFYTIVGIIKNDFTTLKESRNIYIPHTLMMVNYGYYDNITALGLKFDKSKNDAEVIKDKITNFCAEKYSFDKKDKSVLYFSDVEEQINTFEQFYSFVSMFIWFIGISTLLSGIIGVSNTMFMIVRDRTSEIGLKKALGASPLDLKKEFIIEAIIITSIGGLIGLFMGLISLELISSLLLQEKFISNVRVNLEVAFGVTLIIILSGTLAGVSPALSASKINPIDAIRKSMV